MYSLFIFRRVLRLTDNISLIECSRRNTVIIPCFIFDPRQVGNNKYKSDNCIQFMVESLLELNDNLQKLGSTLFTFYGKEVEVVKKILKQFPEINSIYTTTDYTPFARKRSVELQEICRDKISLFELEDILLNPMGSILKSDSTMYVKFTPYYKAALEYNNICKIPKPNYRRIINFIQVKKQDIKYLTDFEKIKYTYNKLLYVKGGRRNAVKVLKRVTGLNSGLSAYIKFGCISIREVYHHLKVKRLTEVIRQLYWRDFYYTIVNFYPHTIEGVSPSVKGVYSFTGRNFRNTAITKQWFSLVNTSLKKPDKKALNNWRNWCAGTTNIPIIDACMRQLNTVGYINNRCRLIVASFLVKDLHWNWEDGELYFASKLVDYDPALNNGNWQWVAGTGADYQAPFHKLNPITQQKKYDPEKKFISKWL